MDYYTIIHICRVDKWSMLPLLYSLNKRIFKIFHKKDILLEWMGYRFDNYYEPNAKWMYNKLPIINNTPLELYEKYTEKRIIFVEDYKNHFSKVFNSLHGLDYSKDDYSIEDNKNKFVMRIVKDSIIIDRYRELTEFIKTFSEKKSLVNDEQLKELKRFVLKVLLVEFGASIAHVGSHDQIKLFELYSEMGSDRSKYFLDVKGNPVLITTKKYKDEYIFQSIQNKYEEPVISQYLSSEEYIGDFDNDFLKVEYSVENVCSLLIKAIPRNQLSSLHYKIHTRLELINSVLCHIELKPTYTIRD